jgi:hypothetical protein
MRLANVTARSGGLPAVYTFNCNLCCVDMMKADAPLAVERAPTSEIPLPAAERPR